jgi:hypothetical protein
MTSLRLPLLLRWRRVTRLAVPALAYEASDVNFLITLVVSFVKVFVDF